MDREENFGGYYSSGQNMSWGFEPSGLGTSVDMALLVDTDFLAGKVADNAGIAVIAATAVEMASESTKVLGDRKDHVAEDSLADCIDLHHNLEKAHEAVGIVAAPDILL